MSPNSPSSSIRCLTAQHPVKAAFLTSSALAADQKFLTLDNAEQAWRSTQAAVPLLCGDVHHLRHASDPIVRSIILQHMYNSGLLLSAALTCLTSSKDTLEQSLLLQRPAEC